MKIRVFELAGIEIELHDFGYAQYLYPAFNGNLELNTQYYDGMSDAFGICIEMIKDNL